MKNIIIGTVIIFCIGLLFSCKTGKNTVNDNSVEKTRVTVEDIAPGNKYWGLKVDKYDYTDAQNFFFSLKGNIILSGTLVMADNLVFTPDKNENNGILVVNGFEKPFFMWMNFSNEEDIFNALSEDQKEKLKKYEPIEVTLEIKNYYVSAAYYNLFVKSDFIKIIK